MRAIVMSGCLSASVAVSPEQHVRSASCSACHQRLTLGENSGDMEACLRVGERARLHPCVYSLMTKWFCSARLETRTKESNKRASSWVAKPVGAMKVTAGILAPATDQSIERGLSMSISVRTRKMVNYACAG